ncbi:hypothetical protein ACFVU3_17065 [Streptomyces sp. NPDC058052]|uniref:hypothetical protein n=1 Tax=Streptomyces sp. NPDC058052 TaxID=3346316 RepID=UPI0036F0CEEA
MAAFLPLLVIGASIAGVLALLTRLAVVARRRGGAGAAVAAAMAAHDEAFRVTAHESYVEIQAQATRKAPLLSPDGPWHSPYPAGPRTGRTAAPRTRRRGSGLRFPRHLRRRR